MFVMNGAIQFWWSEPSPGGLLCQAVFGCHRRTATNYLWWTNDMKKILRVFSWKQMFRASGDILGEMMMLRLVQKSVEWLRDVVSKFHNVGEPVLDIYGGTFERAKLSTQLPDYYTCVGCQKNSRCSSWWTAVSCGDVRKAVFRLDRSGLGSRKWLKKERTLSSRWAILCQWGRMLAGLYWKKFLLRRQSQTI